VLFHELAHAAEMLLGTYNKNDPEPTAIREENYYRASRGLPARGGWEGGCRGIFTPGPGGPGGPGSVNPSQQSAAPNVCTPLLLSIPQAIGTDHTFPVSAIASGERSYLVNVNNQSSDTFTQIVVFYKRIGLSGVVFLKAENVQPGQVAGFVCGLSKNLESYVIGFFLGDDLVQQIPSTGDMTPALASILNPTDTDPCIDSWMITDN
jgi:hypothetical protein